MVDCDCPRLMDEHQVPEQMASHVEMIASVCRADITPVFRKLPHIKSNEYCMVQPRPCYIHQGTVFQRRMLTDML